jgi:hypothetical protein
VAKASADLRRVAWTDMGDFNIDLIFCEHSVRGTAGSTAGLTALLDCGKKVHLLVEKSRNLDPIE